MRIIIGINELKLEKLERLTMNEIRNHFSSSKAKVILLDKAEDPINCYRLNYRAAGSENSIVEIGFFSSFTIDPALLQIHGSNEILIGYDKYVSGINLDSLSHSFDIELNAPFYNFINYLDDIIIIYEIGVMSINAKGIINWSFHSDDIISLFRVQDKSIAVNFFEGGKIKLELESGRIMK